MDLQATRRRLARRVRAGEKGMTLLEIMIVIAILGMIASVLVVAVVNRLDAAKIKTTKLKINNVKSALEQYKVDFGDYPSQGEGLRALISPPEGNPPYLKDKTVPKDDFGNELMYFNPSRHGGGPFEIMSKGPDGSEGTEDDIKSR